MIQTSISISSASPIAFGKALPPKTANKGDDEWDDEKWAERAHYDSKGEVYIPPSAMKLCLASAARYLNIQKKGQSTWTKHFVSGVLITDPLMLGVKRDALRKLPIFVPSSGKPGPGSRVWRRFPVLDNWSATCRILITDISIPVDIFDRVLSAAGTFIGLGSLRPENRGWFGLFTAERVKDQWQDIGDTLPALRKGA